VHAIFLNKVYKDQNGNKLSESEGEFLTAAVFVGMLFGGLMSGIISDNIGRRKCLLAALTINTIAALLSSISPNTPSLIACRVLAGVGVGASVPSVFTMAAEVFPSDKRGEYMTVISSAWMFGSIFTAGVAWILLGDDTQGNRIIHTSWRVFALLCAVPVLLATIACYVICLESPRYLLNAGRKHEAADVLMAMMKNKDVRVRLQSVTSSSSSSSSRSESPSHQLLESQVSEFATYEEGANSGDDFVDPNLTLYDQCLQGIAWLKRDGKLIITKPHRRPFVALLGIWFALSFGYYGLATWITVLFDDIGLSNVYSAVK
jgi:MFS transporter, VNT family, synaptic vesicle glycoprotein 2